MAMELGDPMKAQYLNTDEIIVCVVKGTKNLGLKMRDITYKRSIRVSVADILENAPSSFQKSVPSGAILTEIDGNNIEGLRVNKVGKLIQNKIDSNQDFVMKFRDPTAFGRQLDSYSASVVSTLVLPQGKTSPRDQRLVVERVEEGKHGQDDRILENGDVGEISFQLRVKDTGEIVDGVQGDRSPWEQVQGEQEHVFHYGFLKAP